METPPSTSSSSPPSSSIQPPSSSSPPSSSIQPPSSSSIQSPSSSIQPPSSSSIQSPSSSIQPPSSSSPPSSSIQSPSSSIQPPSSSSPPSSSIQPPSSSSIQSPSSPRWPEREWWQGVHEWWDEDPLPQDSVLGPVYPLVPPLLRVERLLGWNKNFKDGPAIHSIVNLRPGSYLPNNNLVWFRLETDSIAKLGLEMSESEKLMLMQVKPGLVQPAVYQAPGVWVSPFSVYDRRCFRHDLSISVSPRLRKYVLSGDWESFIRRYQIAGKVIFLAFYQLDTCIRMEILDVDDPSFTDERSVSILIKENTLMENSLSLDNDQAVRLLKDQFAPLKKGRCVLYVYDKDKIAYNLVLTYDGSTKYFITNDWNRLLLKYNIRSGNIVSFIRKSSDSGRLCCYFFNVSADVMSSRMAADTKISTNGSGGSSGPDIDTIGSSSGSVIGGGSNAEIFTSSDGPSGVYEDGEYLGESDGHICQQGQYIQATRAMEAENHSSLNGKVIRVMWSGRDSDLRSEIGSDFVKKLSDSTDCVKLRELFQQFGTILSCKVATSDDGKSKGFGFVQFESESSAKYAIEKLDGSTNDGKQLFVAKFVKKSDRAIPSNAEKYTNLFVKNLDKGIFEKSLEEKFSVYGKIVSVSVTKDENNASRGFGFVNFENSDDAKRALEALHGSELGSKVLYVARAQKKSEREEILRRQFEEKKKERLMKYQASNVYVKNIDDGVIDGELKKYFSNCGTIISAKIMRNQKGVSKGFGFVCFSTPEEANKAVYAFHGFILRGKPLYVAIAQKKEERQAQLQLLYAQRVQGLAGPSAVIPGGYSHFYFPTSGVVSQIPAQAASIYQPTGMRPGWMHNGVPSIVRPRVHLSLGTSAPHNPRQYRQNGGRMNRFGFPQGAALPHTSRWQQPKDSRNHQPTVSAEGLGKISSLVAAAPPEHKKHILGEHLFPLVADHQPDLATKITGMLLEMDNSELLRLLDSPEDLATKVEEGVEVLKLSKSKVSHHYDLQAITLYWDF